MKVIFRQIDKNYGDLLYFLLNDPQDFNTFFIYIIYEKENLKRYTIKQFSLIH